MNKMQGGKQGSPDDEDDIDVDYTESEDNADEAKNSKPEM